MDQLRVIVADDAQFMRVAYKRILDTQEHIEVVAMAADGEEVLKQAELLEPDVAILDIRMPKLNGIEVAQRLKASRPDTGVVIISHYDDTEYILELLKDGPEGKAYLLKTSVDNIDELVRAVEAVAKGQTVLDPVIVQRLAKMQTLQADSPLAQLTEREKDVLGLMAEGYNNAAIAQRLDLAVKSVETYINSIYQHLHLSGEPEVHARVRATLLYLRDA